jgi:Holliday junction DNA helicase RuvA
MISTLTGKVTDKFSDKIVVEVAGVGYGIFVTTQDFGSASNDKITKYFIYENIRENSYDLYGFSNIAAKNLFEQLISVKNIGPKVAMSVLDIADVGTVKNNIAAGEVKFLQTAKGVGRRAAEQIIVELRDKVGAIVTEGAEGVVTRSGVNMSDEAVEALVALGYSPQDAVLALKKVDTSLSAEERIRQALKG